MWTKLKSDLKKLKGWIQWLNPWYEIPIEELSDEDDDWAHIGGPVRIVERSAWTSTPPKYRVPLKKPIHTYVFRFWSDTQICEDDEQCFHLLRKLQDEHMAMGMPDIAWNFMIGSDGSVYEGRGWHTEPSKFDWYLLPFHMKTIDIAYIGEWKDVYVHDVMQQAACRLIKTGVALKVAHEDRWVHEERRDPVTSWDRLGFIQKAERAAQASLTASLEEERMTMIPKLGDTV